MMKMMISGKTGSLVILMIKKDMTWEILEDNSGKEAVESIIKWGCYRRK